MQVAKPEESDVGVRDEHRPDAYENPGLYAAPRQAVT